MHEALHSGLRSDPRDPLCTSDVDVGILEVSAEQEPYQKKKKKINIRLMEQGQINSLLGLIITPDEVVNNVRMS